MLSQKGKRKFAADVQIKRLNKQFITLTVLKTKLERKKQQNDVGKKKEKKKTKKKQQKNPTTTQKNPTKQ